MTWGEYYKSRERLAETTNINKGLLVLKRCISALRTRPGEADAAKGDDALKPLRDETASPSAVTQAMSRRFRH